MQFNASVLVHFNQGTRHSSTQHFTTYRQSWYTTPSCTGTSAWCWNLLMASQGKFRVLRAMTQSPVYASQRLNVSGRQVLHEPSRFVWSFR